MTNLESLTDRLANEANGLKYNAGHLRESGHEARARQLENARQAMNDAIREIGRLREIEWMYKGLCK